jgi:hypothetical protein
VEENEPLHQKLTTLTMCKGEIKEKNAVDIEILIQEGGKSVNGMIV